MSGFKQRFTRKQPTDKPTHQPSQKAKVKNRSVKPRGFWSRRAGVFTFWTMFGFMFLVVLVNVFSPSSDTKADQPAAKPTNKATSQEAVQFAKEFSRAYFTWVNSAEGKAQRQASMAAFLGSGLDEYAGLYTDRLDWHSRFVSAEVKDTEEMGENIANITLKVTFQLYKTDKEGKAVTEEKEAFKYFVVPVAFDGHTFGVYELPKFTYVPERTTLDKVAYQKLKRADTKAANEVKQFLNTFFRSFAEDPQDQLNYILAEDDAIQGLQQTMRFEQVKKAEVFKNDTESGNEYVVFAEVTLADPETGIPFDGHYQLTAIHQNGKYVAAGIDDKPRESVKTRTSVGLEQEPAKEIQIDEELAPEEVKNTEKAEEPNEEKKPDKEKKKENKE